ncbi:MAG: N-6 DNA methylase [Candidatus Hodarchaeota archaeon]
MKPTQKKELNGERNLSGNFINREDLIPPKNLKKVFKYMRNQLAGNFKGATRDEKLVEQLIFLLFCKVKDERDRTSKEPVLFQLKHPNQINLGKRIKKLFNQLKAQYSSLFEDFDALIIDEETLKLIVIKLQYFCISLATRDVIGDAFEAFFGPSLRGNKGQFFTPKNVVSTMVEILDPKPGDNFIDPACGIGGFLTVGLTHINRKVNNQLIKTPLNTKSFFGIDKDCFLAKISRIYLALLGIEENQVFCENSLEAPSNWDKTAFNLVRFNKFDVVCTNPPFGSKIHINSKKILQNYHLGHKWKKYSNKDKELWIQEKKIKEKPPQILFIERCLQLLKPGGRMGIVLPDGIFGNPSDRYVLHFLLKQVKLLAIISCSHLTFLPYTHTKTSLLFLEKTRIKKDYSFFMAIAENVGHDKNGKPLYRMDKAGTILKGDNGDKIINDDFPEILKRYQMFQNGEKLAHSHLGFSIKISQVYNYILIPEYYNPDIKSMLQLLKQNRKIFLQKLGDLVERGDIEITRGHEIGSKFYGTGNIPFVRTSDLINLEINIDPKKRVSQEIYEYYKDKQNVQAGDILFVSDGTFLIGKSAMVTENDTKIIIQSHLKKIRVINRELIDEYVLLWALNTDVVQNQVKAKTFIQATISTIGNRLMELILPIPQDLNLRRKISCEMREIIVTKMNLRERIRKTLELIDLKR